MRLKLVQKIKFHAERITHHTKEVEHEVAFTKYTKIIPPMSHEDWDQIMLVIPPVCSSTIDLKPRLIRVSYQVVLKFDASGMHISKDLVIPITIGTIPMRDSSFVEGSSMPPYSYQISTVTATNMDELSSYIEDTNGDLYESNCQTFKPYYPYFDGITK